jgi:flagellar motor protein MotB
MKIKSNTEQAEIFVFIASFFLIVIGFNSNRNIEVKQDEPPIIVIRDADKYSFASGSAELSSSLEKFVKTELAPQIAVNAQKYNADVIEIIGHTDGQPIETTSSNLDVSLEKAKLGKIPLSQLKAGSNADLGLMRALAVAKELKATGNVTDKLNFRVYSAGQLILTDGSPAPENRKQDATRRRIEIRFTRLGKNQDIN